MVTERFSGKEDVLKRIQIKVRQHELELAFYQKALVKIKPLVEGISYEITYRPQHAGITKEKTLKFYGQLTKVGVDRALFKLFACDTPKSEISLNLFTVGDTELSILWGWDWDAKPADAPATYIAWPWKNKSYEKLLKG